MSVLFSHQFFHFLRVGGGGGGDCMSRLSVLRCARHSNESGDKIISVYVHSTEYFMTLAEKFDSTISHIPLLCFYLLLNHFRNDKMNSRLGHLQMQMQPLKTCAWISICETSTFIPQHMNASSNTRCVWQCPTCFDISHASKYKRKPKACAAFCRRWPE